MRTAMKRIYNRNYFKGVLLTLTLAVTSCDFGNLNVDPSSLPDAPVNLILPSAEMQSARNLGSVGARVTGVIMQQFVGIDAQPLGYNTYLIDENALDDLWRTGLYAGAMKDCIDIIEKGKTKNIPHYTGIAKVLLAMNLGITTSFWGDVPYAEAFQGQAQLRIEYDTQESIYAVIQQLLDDAISDLNLPAGELKPGVDDPIYKGNAALWIGTARALKARYYMHLTKRDADAPAKALAALNGGTIFGNSVEAAFPFGELPTEANPIAYFGTERPNQLALGSFMLSLLDANNDPRKAKYGALSGGNYAVYVKGNTNLFWAQNNSPMPLISYSELLFIQAEAHLRLGNAIAQTKYQQAIRANMERLGIPDADIVTYLTAVGNISSLPFDQQLQRIIEQKYLALYGQGTLETWVDFRRTGYPAITAPADASESFNSTKVIPKRYLYPISERNTNSQNLEAAISRQGGHLLDNVMWAFQ
jgi:hypothetical protein